MTPRTEAEAAELWCPFVRALAEATLKTAEGSPVQTALAGVNRGRSDEPAGDAFTCIGSRCMAWEQIGDGHERRSAPERPGPEWEPSPEYPGQQPCWRRPAEPRGICLAMPGSTR